MQDAGIHNNKRIKSVTDNHTDEQTYQHITYQLQLHLVSKFIDNYTCLGKQL